MNDKICVITGANTGIGKVTAMTIAAKGARVILACRSEARAQAAIKEIKETTGNDRVEFLSLDLSSFESIAASTDALLERVPRIDLLINNAGLAGARGATADGYEVHFGVNHLGHFLWTLRLLDRIESSTPARIVNVASRAHTRTKGISYDRLREPTRTRVAFREYCESKLANVLFSHELAKRLPAGVSTYALHPGVIASDIWRRLPRPIRWIAHRFMKTNEEGAQTSLMCAMDPALEGMSGRYYSEGKELSPSPQGRDDEAARRLWAYSEEAVAAFL